MCLCERPASVSVTLDRGIRYFKCGSCPECLQERSAYWVLRCTAEARTRKERGEPVCMVTLTYDQFLRDKKGDIVFAPDGTPLELPPDVKKLCNKRDPQLFLKRLRKAFPNNNIKYLIAAEHGSHTHRAHYHALLFGVDFGDLKPYKRSNRGNQIYKSKKLNELWKHGICTVDSLVANPAVARYVTKYSMKSRGCDDTFQLFSHGIGEEWLLSHFNGRPYVIDGRSYPVPRSIWEKYISLKYAGFMDFDPRYKAPSSPFYRESKLLRSNYRGIRNSDPVYSSYIMDQFICSKTLERLKPRPEVRVAALDDTKFHFYKAAWFKSEEERYNRLQLPGRFYSVRIDPNASERMKLSGLREGCQRGGALERVFAVMPSCLNTANDTTSKILEKIFRISFDNSFLEEYYRTVYGQKIIK